MAVPARILVTGAGGFVGRHLLPALRAAFPEATLIATTRPGSRAVVAIADQTVAFDLLDPVRVDDAIRTTQPDGLVHLAAQSEVAASFRDPLATWRTNLFGTLTLAEAVLRHVPACRFVLASSAEVYGLSFRASAPLDENAPLAPTNPYAASKAAADLAIGEMALRGLQGIRLRAFNQTGPGQSDSFVVAAFASQVAQIAARRREAVINVGALDRWRDFLDVRDVCQAFVAALNRPLEPGAVFNLASGSARRVGDILDTLITRCGVATEVVEETGRLRPSDIERTCGDSSAARTALGWSPSIAWERTLQDVLVDWRMRIAGNAKPSG